MNPAFENLISEVKTTVDALREIDRHRQAHIQALSNLAYEYKKNYEKVKTERDALLKAMEAIAEENYKSSKVVRTIALSVISNAIGDHP